MNYLKLQNTEKVAVIDAEDFDRLSLFKWSITGNCTNIQRMYRLDRNCYHVSLASEIMHQPGCLFDHKDGNIFNNIKANLRSATHKQNCRNKKKQKGHYSSPYKGVSWNKALQKWVAHICVDYSIKHLGYFTDEKAAASAYNAAAIKFFGEFANLNVL